MNCNCGNNSNVDNYTVNELANILRISSGTVYNRMSRGDKMPPRIKVSRKVLFPKAEFRIWMKKLIEVNE